MCIHGNYLRASKESFVLSRYKELKKEASRIDLCKNRLIPSKIQHIFKIGYKEAKAFIKITKTLMEKYKRFLIHSEYSEKYVMNEYSQDFYWKKYFKMKRRHYTKLLLMLPTIHQDSGGRLLIMT